jgi:pectate lyase
MSVKRTVGAFAALLISLTQSASGADGYANVNGTTTGGTGTPVVVTTLAQLTAAITDDVSRVVHVSGTINLGSSNVRFGSNKTLIGLGSNSGFVGNLKGVDENNVIIQNLNFSNPNSVGDGDGLTLDGCTHIWVDNCTFTQCGDGSLDITHGADFVTVSWCKFQYTSNTGHNFVNLIGHSDNNASEDTGKLHVTFHHNWWSTLCVERMPRVRFGRVHTYNNYFSCAGNNQCIRASIQSQVLAENNYFENIDQPYEKFESSDSTGNQVGLIRAVGNVTVNCTGVQAFNDSVFTPPYSYSLQTPAAARTAIIANAGTGSGGGNTPPTVSITSPANGATFTAGANITINATASDPGGSVSSVQFFRNGISIGTDTSSPYSVTWNSVPAGNYALTAVATDNGGAQTTSATVNITVGGGGGGTTTTIQAESASFGGGVTIDNNNAGFNGTGFANFPTSGGFLQFNNVNGGAGGTATITVRFALGITTSRTGQRIINGGSAQNITFNPTGSWTTWNTMSFTATLNSGTGNTVRFQSNGQDLGNIDQITIVAP